MPGDEDSRDSLSEFLGKGVNASSHSGDQNQPESEGRRGTSELHPGGSRVTAERPGQRPAWGSPGHGMHICAYKVRSPAISGEDLEERKGEVIESRWNRNSFDLPCKKGTPSHLVLSEDCIFRKAWVKGYFLLLKRTAPNSTGKPRPKVASDTQLMKVARLWKRIG